MSVEFARSLRKNMTSAEARLWIYLRQLRPEGFHFRRQSPLHGYVLDFVCFGSRLIIEVDGDTHGTTTGIARDAVRTAKLEANGFRIIRFTNADVLGNIDGVMQAVTTALRG